MTKEELAEWGMDRMLAAQAEIENLPILSNDKIFDKLSVRRIW